MARESTERKNTVAEAGGKDYTEAEQRTDKGAEEVWEDDYDGDDLPFAFGEENASEAVKTAEKAASKAADPRESYQAREELRQAAEKTLGQSGQRAILGAYETGQDTAEYYAGFSAYYQAAVDGKAQETVKGDYAAGLTPAQRMAAYTAGQNDAQSARKAEAAAGGYAGESGEGTGLVYDEFVRQAVNSGRRVTDSEGNRRVYLTAQDAQRINDTAKALGLRVRFADEVEGGKANAQIQGGEVLIEKDNPNPIMFLVGHEMTHRMQELAPEEYRAFRETLEAEDKSWSEKVKAVQALYAQQGLEISAEKAADEVAADKAGQLLEDGRLLDEFIHKHREDRTLLEKVRDAIRGLIAKLTGAEKRKAQTAEGKLTAALEAASKAANKNATQEGGETKLSIKYDRKNTPYVLIEEDILDGVPRALWVKTVKETLRKKFPKGVTVGNSVVRIDKQSVQEMTFSRYTQRLMRTEPAFYADKLRATNNADEILRASRNYVNEALAHPRKDSIQEFARGDVLLQIGTRGYSGQVVVAMRANQTLLLYDLLNLKPAVIDKKIGHSKVNTANSQSETGSQATSDTDSLLDGDGKVKTKFSLKSPVEETRDRLEKVNGVEGARFSLKTDSKGRKLTAGQREYFKDSKVLDQDGQLKVMYRGGSGDFTVFDRKKSSYSNLYGRGFYFTDSEIHAKQYGNPRAFYLNITSPVSTDETTITRSQMRKFLKAVAENEDDYSFENYGYETTVDSVLKSVYGKSDFAMLYDVSQTAIGDMVAAVELFNEVNGTDYDGLILDTETVTFRSEQAKNIDNQNPTSDPDIRHSLKGSETAREMAKLRAENELLRDGLKKAGVRTLEYEPGNEADRLEKVNGVEGARFSLKGNYKTIGKQAWSQVQRERMSRYGGEFDHMPRVDMFFANDKLFVVENWNEDSFGVIDRVDPGKNQAKARFIWEVMKHGGLGDTESYRRTAELYRSTAGNEGGNSVYAGNAGAGEGNAGLYAGEGRAADTGSVVDENAGNHRENRNSLKGTTISRNYEALVEENRLLKEQVAGYAALKKKALDLTKDRDYWKSQTRLTKGFATDHKAVEKAAKSLVREYGATIEAGDIQKPLQKLYDYLARGYDETGPVDSGEAWQRARDIARELVENAVEADEEYYEQYAGLRNYLRETKLVLGEGYQADFPDFNAFRKAHMGKLRLGTKGATNIDQVYQELSYLYPEFFDETRQTTPQDQLARIAEVADGIYRVVEHNPFAEYMDEAITGAANEILDLFFDLPQTKKTFADRKQAEYIQRTSRIVENLREKNRKRVRQVMDRERTRRIEGIREVKERYNALDKMSRQRRQQTETRGKLNRMVDKLSRKLLRPTDTLHIPEDMRGAVANLLESINRESGFDTVTDPDGTRRRVPRGTALGAELTKRTQAFSELKAKYAHIVENAATNGMQMVIDPQLLGDKATPGLFDEVIQMADVPLANMTAEELGKVYKVVKAVDWSINRAGQLLTHGKYARTEEWANALKADCGERKSKRPGLGLSKSLETPYTYFSHFGEAGKAVYRMLRDAQDRETVMNQQVAQTVEDLVDAETVKQLERDAHEFELESGEKLTLTTAHIMELFLLVRREQAQGHLMEGGVVQPEIKSRNIRQGSVQLPLTAGDIQNITGVLTADQQKLAAGLQQVTAGLLADLGNEASMTAYGYKKFTEKGYWPLKVADIGVRHDVEQGGEKARSIANIGMAKPLTPGASNPIRLNGVFQTFATHASDMVSYAAWLCPMEDANRLYNYRFWEDGAPTTERVAPMLEEAGGTGAGQYWQKLMEDIQNGIRSYDFEPMTNQARKLVGSFKGAAVGGNIRVIIQQPTAFFRAGAVLDARDMARAAKAPTKGDGWEKAKKYAPIAARKDLGGFDIANPKSMYETLFDGRDWTRRASDALSAGAGKADAVTWGGLWNACEWAVKREHSELKVGSQEYYQETAKVFTEMIDQTQVVDGVLQRSNIMRGKNDLAQQATAFMGEPIMSLNLMMRSWEDWRAERNPEKRSKARKRLARAGAALMVTNVVNALAQSMIDAIRDDDRDQDYWERFWAAFSGLDGTEANLWEKVWNAVTEGNAGSNLNPIEQIPFVKDVHSLIQGYDVSRADTEIISDMVRAAQTFIQSADGKGSKTRAYAVKELLAAGAKFFGLPVANLARDSWGIARSIVNEMDSVPLMYAMEKAVYNVSNSGNTRRYYAIMYRALEKGDYESYEKIRRDLMDESAVKENGVAAVNGAAIESAMRSRYATAKEKDPDYQLERKALELMGYVEKRTQEEKTPEKFSVKNLTPDAYEAYVDQRNEDYSDGLARLEKTKLYTSLGDEGKDDVTQALYDLAEEMALEDHSGGEYEISTKWMTYADEAQRKGLDLWEYALFHVAYQSAATTRDADGKAVKGEGKSDHVRAWLEENSGLTEAQREFLWGTVYTSEW